MNGTTINNEDRKEFEIRKNFTQLYSLLNFTQFCNF